MSRASRKMPAVVQHVQEDIRQERRNDSALWSSRLGLGEPCPPPITILDRTLQPHTDQPKHAAVHHSVAQADEQLSVVDRLEVGFKVCVVYGLVAIQDMRANLLKRVMGRAPRTKAEGAVHEVLLEDRLQD